MTNAKKKLVHLFDVTQCVGCKACIVACAETNYPDMLNEVNSAWDGLPANIRVMTLEKARRPVQLLVQCQQCDNAPCVTVCPFGANFHDPATGNVKTDPNRCIGCGYCVTACPYDVRWLHPKTGLPVKCMGEGCEKLTAAGQLPARAAGATSMTRQAKSPFVPPRAAPNGFCLRRAPIPTSSWWSQNDSRHSYQSGCGKPLGLDYCAFPVAGRSFGHGALFKPLA